MIYKKYIHNEAVGTAVYRVSRDHVREDRGQMMSCPYFITGNLVAIKKNETLQLALMYSRCHCRCCR